MRRSEKIPDLARASNTSEERILFVNHSHTWQHWLQIFGRRPPSPGEPFSRSRKENRPQPVQFDSGEELVWRRSGYESTNVTNSERRQEIFNSYEQPALRSFQSQEAAPAAARFEPPAALQITKLDPALVDRLTDDVIRRVEQRVRIERERRGL